MAAKKKWSYAAVLAVSGILAGPAACVATTGANARSGQSESGAVFEDALTFAQVDDEDRISTILIVGISDDHVQGINLSGISNHYAQDAFDVVNGLTWEKVERIARAKKSLQSFAVTQLVGVGPRGLAHIAAGTNYPEHGKETGMDEDAFLFPKFSQATGPRGHVATAPGILLDYEAEVCARFDREIRTLADFDAAKKGFFLCGDFSDRAALFREINLKNPYSGDGFPDAKSGPGRFPAGPFLVVPKNWEAFLDRLNFKTFVDGEKRQDVNASNMIKDLRTIVKETLAEGSTRTWSYASGRVHMIQRSAIGTESAVLTGTGDGVVFREPSPELIKELMEAPDRSHELEIIGRFVDEEDAKRKYLQVGSTVRHTSNYLGWIDTQVVSVSSGEAAANGL